MHNKKIKNNVVIIDVKNINNINKIIKNTKYYINLCDKNNYKIKYLTKDKQIKEIEKAINIKDINKRYSYIYDTVCDYIDKKYLDCNYCNFKDNVCIYYRSLNKMDHINGCCSQDFRGGDCTYLKNNKCSIKSISCKLYSCPILRENKINFRMKDIPLIKYFFNIKQKYYIKYSFFKDKDYVIDKLISNR